MNTEESFSLIYECANAWEIPRRISRNYRDISGGIIEKILEISVDKSVENLSEISSGILGKTVDGSHDKSPEELLKEFLEELQKILNKNPGRFLKKS